MAATRQTSFSGGELAPTLWGRTDLERYAHGARLLRNFFVSRHGSAVSRPGAELMGYAYGGQRDLGTAGAWPVPVAGGTHQYVTGGSKVRLVPFYWSDTDTKQNYVLEFGVRYVRVLKGGQPIPGLAIIPTNYRQEHLFKLRWAQSGDVIFLACAGYPPAKISRTSETSWAFEYLDFTRPPPKPDPLSPGTPVDFRVDVSTAGATDEQHPEQWWSWMVTERRRDSRGLIYESAPVRANPFTWAGQEWSSQMDYPQGFIVAASVYGQTAPNDGVRGQCVGFGAMQANSGQNPLAGYADGSGTSTAAWCAIRQWGALAGGYATGEIAFSTSGGVRTFYRSTVNNNTTSLGHSPEWSLLGTTPTIFDQWAEIDTSPYVYYDILVPLGPDRPISLWVANAEGNSLDPNFVGYRIYRGRGKNFGYVDDTTSSGYVDVGKEPDLNIAPPQSLNPFDVKDDDGTPIRTETPIAVTFFEDALTFIGTPERPHFIFKSRTGDYTNFDQRLIVQDDDALVFALASRKREVARAALGLDKLHVFTDASLWSVGGANGPMTPTSIDAHVNVDIGADWPMPLIVEGAALWVRNKGTGVRLATFEQERASLVAQDLSVASEHLLLGYSIVDWCFAEDPWGVVWVVRSDGVLLSLTFSPENQLWAWAEHEISTPYVGGGAHSICSIPEGDEDVVYLAMNGRPSSAWVLGTTYQMGEIVTYNGFTFASRIDNNTNNLPNVGGIQNTWWTPTTSTTGPAMIMRLETRLETDTKRPFCLDAYVPFDGPFPAGGGANSISSPGPDGRGLHHLDGLQVYAVYDSGDIFGPLTVAAGGVVVPAPTDDAERLAIGLIFDPILDLLDLPQGKTIQKVVNEVGLELRVGHRIGAEVWVGPDSSLKPGSSLRLMKLNQNDVDLGQPMLVRAPTRGTWNSQGRAALVVKKPIPVTVLGVTREVERGD